MQLFDMPGWALVFQLGKKPLIAADRLIRSVARRVMGHMESAVSWPLNRLPLKWIKKRATNWFYPPPLWGMAGAFFFARLPPFFAWGHSDQICATVALS